MKKGKMIIEKEDTPTHLPMDVRSILADAQEVSSEMSIAQNDDSVKKIQCHLQECSAETVKTKIEPQRRKGF